jgi:thymidylate synthase
MNKLDLDYQNLLQDVLDNGVTKETRNGGTISVFGRQIRHKMSDGFPLLTTKKMAWKTMVTELLWFLRGDTNIKYLVDNDCHIWDGDCFANYVRNFTKYVDSLPEDSETEFIINKDKFINKIKTDDEFAKKWGDLGPIYGKQWRAFGGYEKVPSGWYHHAVTHYKDVPKNDQIQNLIHDLKTNPDSRRLMVTAWNPAELDQMVLPPCHYGFQVYTRELSFEERVVWMKNNSSSREIILPQSLGPDFSIDEFFKPYGVPTRAISLMWNQRSVDTFLGLPFNIASYGLLLEIIAKSVNMVPDQLIGNLGDVHLYSNHIEEAKEQIGKDLTDEERYHIWFGNNYETGMERFFDPNNLPNFNDVYYEPTPTRTREPYPLPTFKHLRSDDKYTLLNEFPSLWSEFKISDFEMENYQSHPTIKAPLSN